MRRGHGNGGGSAGARAQAPLGGTGRGRNRRVCARGGLLRCGTGFPTSCDHGVTNIFADHLRFNDVNTRDAMAAAKSETVRGTDPFGIVVLSDDKRRVPRWSG